MYSSSRDMFALWLESILIGHVVDGVFHVGLWVYPAEASTNSQRFVFGSYVNQFGGFLMSLSIGKFVAIVVTAQANIVRGCLLENQYVFLMYLRSSGNGDNDEGESDELQRRGKYLTFDMKLNIDT